MFTLTGLNFFLLFAILSAQVSHAEPPQSTFNKLDAASQSVSELNGTASANSAVSQVYLTIKDEDLGYFWNGTAFQKAPTQVPATLLGTGGKVEWHYSFPNALASGEYSVSSVAVDSQGIEQSARTIQLFSVTSDFVSVGNGSWGPVIQTPSIAVAAANLPDGKILHWAAYKTDDYKPSNKDFAQTYTSIFDPMTGQSTLDLVTETEHDMFCMGANILEDGRVLMNGGNSHGKTSIFDSTTGTWISEDDMNIARAYQGNTMLADGRVLTLGGSWKYSALCRGQNDNSGTCVDKTAEVWDPDNGWSVLSGISPNSLTTDDVDGLFRSDNHMWLFSVPGGKVLHAGPSRKMHLLDVSGDGSITSVGNRADDADAMNGNAVMFDTGKILTVGGAPNYEQDDATKSAFVIDVSGDNVSARRVGSMRSKRAYHNSVVLPNGEVIVIGGQAYPTIFSDSRSAMKPELWSPVTETFRELDPMQIPRNYHSVALLTQDGRVLAGGGGLCGTCINKNHSDLEILTPPYLYDSDGNLASRPAILSAPASATYGNVINVKTDSAVSSIVLMRASAVTHSVNNAQRRVPLDFTRTDGNNNVAVIPTDSGAVTPGNYMLFVLDENGVPSTAATINIRHHPNAQHTEPFVLENNKWELLTPPGNIGNQSIEELFGDSLPIEGFGTSWIVFSFDSDIQDYRVPSVDYVPEIGEGLWIIQILENSITIRLPIAAALSAAIPQNNAYCHPSRHCIKRALPTGDRTVTWAMIGSPSRQNIPVSTIRLVSDAVNSGCTQGCSIADASVDQLTSGHAWAYDSNLNEYIELSESDSQSPWQAFWFNTLPYANEGDLEILLPVGPPLLY